jgi:hypothetical protein
VKTSGLKTWSINLPQSHGPVIGGRFDSSTHFPCAAVKLSPHGWQKPSLRPIDWRKTFGDSGRYDHRQSAVNRLGS